MTFVPYNPTELFQIFDTKNKEKKGRIKNYDYPFDFEFKKREDVFIEYGKKAFCGSGIYLIKYKEEIIYIGKYMPYNDGNVINDRWIKHIATITNRGHRVSGFGKGNKKYELLEKIGFLFDKSTEYYKEFIVKAGRIKGDYSTSVKRLEFANKHWDTFRVNKSSEFEENVLPKFQFYYMQINGHKEGEIPDTVKEKEYYENLASLVETYLLWKYNPACNSNNGLIDINQNINVDHIKKDINYFLEKLN